MKGRFDFAKLFIAFVWCFRYATGPKAWKLAKLSRTALISLLRAMNMVKVP